MVQLDPNPRTHTDVYVQVWLNTWKVIRVVSIRLCGKSELESPLIRYAGEGTFINLSAICVTWVGRQISDFLITPWLSIIPSR